MIKGSTTWSNASANRLGGNFGLTAAVIRTKMGAGLVILLGSPAIALLLAWALARSIYLARRPGRPAAGHGI